MSVKVIIPLSGGKDSQASLLWAIEKFGVEKCEAIFCDVKWEAEETYQHIDYLVKRTGVKLTTIASKKYDGMVGLAKKKGRFPSSQARFCTQELKIYPMIDYILEQECNLFIVDGIRADESESRANKQSECRYFKHYFDPIQSNSLLIEKLSKKSPEKLSFRERNNLEKAKERLAKGKEDYKFLTYRKKEVIEWCKKYADDLFRPFFHSTAIDVINYSLNRNIKINPLYYKGFSRVGCMPCIMCTKFEITEIVKNREKDLQKIKDAEKEVNSSFFAPAFLPKRYHSKIANNGKKYLDMNDVERYIKDKNATGDLFPEFGEECKSIYGLCSN